jgi:hypothetical protein
LSSQLNYVVSSPMNTRFHPGQTRLLLSTIPSTAVDLPTQNPLTRTSTTSASIQSGSRFNVPLNATGSRDNTASARPY